MQREGGFAPTGPLESRTRCCYWLFGLLLLIELLNDAEAFKNQQFDDRWGGFSAPLWDGGLVHAHFIEANYAPSFTNLQPPPKPPTPFFTNQDIVTMGSGPTSDPVRRGANLRSPNQDDVA